MQRLRIGGVLIGHRRQDEVRGAIDDATQGLDAVRGQRLAQRADDGDASTDRALEVQINALAQGATEELFAVHRQQGLVGGDHVPPGVDGPQHQSARRRRPADQLHHHLDPGVCKDTLDVGGEHVTQTGRSALLRRVPDQHLPHLDPGTDAPLQVGGVVLEDVVGAQADVAQSQQGDANGFLALFAPLPLPPEAVGSSTYSSSVSSVWGMCLRPDSAVTLDAYQPDARRKRRAH